MRQSPTTYDAGDKADQLRQDYYWFQPRTAWGVHMDRNCQGRMVTTPKYLAVTLTFASPPDAHSTSVWSGPPDDIDE